jgi:hypothetical protein
LCRREEAGIRIVLVDDAVTLIAARRDPLAEEVEC